MKLYNNPQTERVLTESFEFLNNTRDYIHILAFELVTLLEFQATRNAIIKFNDMLPSEYQNAIAIEEFNPLINLTSEDAPELFKDGGEMLELPERILAIREMLKDAKNALLELKENA